MNIEDHKITFINRNDEYHTTQITISSDAVLPDVIEAFELFLRGSGYDLEGSIGIVDEVKSIDLNITADSFRVVPEDEEQVESNDPCKGCEFDGVRCSDEEPCNTCTNIGYAKPSNWQSKEKPQESKSCNNCKFDPLPYEYEPCCKCGTDGLAYSNWKPKVTKACTNCKFDYLSPFDVPCSNCENDHSNWQPKQ